MIYDCIVVGAGASGLFFGSKYRGRGNLLIIDASDIPGKKILMTGGGSCNITHGGFIKDFTENYYENGNKIRSVLYKHSNIELMEFMKERGVETIIRSDGKVFPKSMKAEDIRDALVKSAEGNGFEIRTETKLTGVTFTEYREDLLKEITVERRGKKEVLLCKNLIFATGGCSYPSTGSNGSAFGILRNLPGIEVTTLKPSLGPVFVKDYNYGAISGVSVENVRIQVERNGKIIAREEGDILFAERCFSGPVVMHLSRYMEPGDYIVIDYINCSDSGAYRKELNKAMNESRKKLSNFLSEYTGLPKSLCECIERKSEGKIREAGKTVLGDRFEIEYPGGLNRAMTTAGGISLRSVNLKTMELKLKGEDRNIPGVFAIGEVLDVDGKCGGYNLQFAYSSASVCAEKIEK